MKQISILFLFLCVAINIQAQDLIYKSERTKDKTTEKINKASNDINALDLESIINKVAALSTLTNTKASSLFTDVITDKIKNSKVALSVGLTNAAGDTIRDINTLMSLGGNVSLRSLTNIYSLKKGEEASKNNLMLVFHPKLSFNVPTGNADESFTGSLDTGVELLFNITTNEKKLAIIGKIRSAVVYGTKDFTANIAFEGRQFFSYGQAVIGLVLVEKAVITASFPIAFNAKDPIDKVGSAVSLSMLF